MAGHLTEDYLVEQPAINWFKEIGYSYIHGSELIPDKGERESYRHCILKRRFIDAIKRINPWLNDFYAEEVYKKVIELDHPDFIMKGKLFYDYLTNGVKLTIRERREEKTRIIKIIDFETINNNEFLVANQFTVENQFQKNLYRKPDIVIFINGLPLSVFELKSFNANETARDAYLDHKLKIQDIPQLYVYSQIIVASDGYETKYGSPTSDWERFFVWEGILSDDDIEVKETIDGNYQFLYNKKELTTLEILIKGLFNKENLLEFLNDFIFYEKVGETFEKKIAIYTQFYTVKKAIKRTVNCVCKGTKPEDRRIGVVWHTQGSGKSMTMLFYARKALKLQELNNPLLIFITDRNNLDEQLYKLFSQIPIVKQAKDINDLQEIIRNTAGGIIFATIQKFKSQNSDDYPTLTERRNVIVIADEAHRSQYRELAKNLRIAIPNASFMGFTATPIELQDRDTYLVFGDPISIYSMDKALRHKVIVPIYYEARLVELHLTNEFIDEEFEEISESLEPEFKENLKRKYAKLENLILNPERLEKISKDIVEHFNKRIQEFEGKGMVVVISRKVAVELYNKIKQIPDAPSIAVIISGERQNDPPEFSPHLRNKSELEELLNNFKNPEKDPKMVIVVDMLLTGFDVPCLHTMYFDKPLKNHNLLQAIARVNRVFKDKPAGLIVDYIGIADNLRKSLSKYTIETIKEIFTDINQVISILKEKYDIISSMLYGYDYKNWKSLSPEDLAQLTVSVYNSLSEEDKKEQFLKHFLILKKIYALASPHPETIKIKDDIVFFEMIKKMIVKYSAEPKKELSRDLEYEINQLISKSISAEEPVDIFSLMQKEKPDLSILDEKFLESFKNIEQRKYLIDVFISLLNNEIKVRIRRNPVRYKSLYDMLKQLIDKYNFKLIDTADVINELIEIAKEIKNKIEEGKKLDLTEEELVFYDMLLKQDIFKDDVQIKNIAKEIVKHLGNFIRIVDWNKKETLRAKIKMSIKKILLNAVNENVEYQIIDNIASQIYDHIEILYAA